MGSPDNQAPLMVLGALFALVVLVLVVTPLLLYMALGLLAVVYGWYALVCIVTSVGLTSYLLKDHDQPPPLSVRKVSRIV